MLHINPGTQPEICDDFSLFLYHICPVISFIRHQGRLLLQGDTSRWDNIQHKHYSQRLFNTVPVLHTKCTMCKGDTAAAAAAAGCTTRCGLGGALIGNTVCVHISPYSSYK